MAELPKIVRQRMREEQEPEPHPDAGLLTAFAENSLTPRERDQVLAHLSLCAVCREVVSLALPEMPAESKAAAAPARVGWLRWPALRWAAVGSAATIVMAAVMLSYQGKMLRSRMAPGTPAQPAKVAAPAAAPSAETAADQRVAANQPRGREAQDVARAQPQAKGAGTPPARSLYDKFAEQSLQKTQIASHGPAPTQKMKEQALVSEMAQPAAPLPGTAGKVDETRNLETKRAPVRPDAVAVTESEAARDKMLDKDRPRRAEESTQPGLKALPAKPPAIAGAVQSEAAGKGEMAKRPQAVNGGLPGAQMSMAAPARWTISEAGKLRRSADSGKTWRQVEVDSATFRSLSVVANDVWAGGADGVLFHSADGGIHWTRVRPVAMSGTERIELAGDVVRIEFQDALRGKIEARGEVVQVWTTTDGGRTWSVGFER